MHRFPLNITPLFNGKQFLVIKTTSTKKNLRKIATYTQGIGSCHCIGVGNISNDITVHIAITPVNLIIVTSSLSPYLYLIIFCRTKIVGFPGSDKGLLDCDVHCSRSSSQITSKIGRAVCNDVTACSININTATDGNAQSSIYSVARGCTGFIIIAVLNNINWVNAK